MVRVWAEKKLRGHSAFLRLFSFRRSKFYLPRNKSPCRNPVFLQRRTSLCIPIATAIEMCLVLLSSPQANFSPVEGKIIHFPLSTDASMVYGSFSTKTVEFYRNFALLGNEHTRTVRNLPRGPASIWKARN
jgi:hypothetical protein